MRAVQQFLTITACHAHCCVFATWVCRCLRYKIYYFSGF